MVVIALAWLRWESAQPLDQWYSARHGILSRTSVAQAETENDKLTQTVIVESGSGLTVRFRVVRNTTVNEPLPVVLVLGGHETGSGVVDLCDTVGQKVIVALDYPYQGPKEIDKLSVVVRHLPDLRRTFRDTPAAVFLVLDWLESQPWADVNRTIIAGVSFGVPFAAAAAARDDRVNGLMLVHGAADNQLWFEFNVGRRIKTRMLQRPTATLLNWLAYGPVYDTSANVTRMGTRPVVIVGAREDERTPAGQAELLFDAATGPRKLLWTKGQHVEPGRRNIIDSLLQILDQELPFLTAGVG